MSDKEREKLYKIHLEKNERAFPIYCNLDDSVNLGISKREYFAAMALSCIKESLDVEKTAQRAVELADALIEELNKD